MADAPELETLKILQFGSEPDLVNASIQYVQAALPGWQPRVGNTEMVLIESLALMLGVEVLAIELLPGRLQEQLMRLFGVIRDPGSAAVGRVQITVTNSAPVQIIPAGTRFRFGIESTGETVDVFALEQTSIITSESLTGQVNVIAATTGTAANGTLAGTLLNVVDPLPFIESVVLVTAMSGGKEVEADAPFYGRAAATLSRLTTTLVGPDTFQYAALQQPGVGRAKVFDNYDPAAPGATSYGHVTVAVADLNGAALSSDGMAAIENWLTSQALASLSVHVIAPTYTTVDLTVTVQAVPGYTTAQVQAAVTAVVSAWINPVSWDWSSTVSQYQLVAVLAGASGVQKVTSAPADIALTGKAPLPILGTLTVNVTA